MAERRANRARAAFAAASAALAFAFTAAAAPPVSREEAAAIAVAWRGQDVAVRDVATYEGAGTGTFHVVTFESGGFVAVAGETSAAPVMAFSAAPEFVAEESNPLWTLLREDAAARATGGASGGRALPTTRGASGGRALSTTRGASGGRALSTTRAAGVRASAGASALAKIYDERVSPLLQSKWDQGAVGGAKCYNYYTPSGYLCGCVATAGAQIMRYHRHPEQAVAQTTYYTGVYNETTRTTEYLYQTTLGGVYDWDSMPLAPEEETALSGTQREAIGRLTFDVGVACTMYYGVLAGGGSDAPLYMLRDCLEELFHYGNADCIVFGYDCIYYENNVPKRVNDLHFTLEGFKDAVVPSLEAGLPVALHIGPWTGAHAVVADGYGYSGDGTFYIHVNMGWSGTSDGWYAPPDIDDYSGIPIVVYNIDPDGKDADSLVGGRVVSGGAAADGAEISAFGAGGVLAGSAASGSTGAYVLALPPGEYVFKARLGDKTAQRRVTVGECINVTGDEYGNVECPEVYFGAGVEYSDATGNWFGVDFEPKLRRMTLFVR